MYERYLDKFRGISLQHSEISLYSRKVITTLERSLHIQDRHSCCRDITVMHMYVEGLNHWKTGLTIRLLMSFKPFPKCRRKLHRTTFETLRQKETLLIMF